MPPPAPQPLLDGLPRPHVVGLPRPQVVGLLLAAGAGTRLGRPKALVTDAGTGEPWLARGIRTLRAGGCTTVLVVLGAEHDAARALLPPGAADVHVVVADDWAEGLGASLRTGLTAAAARGADLVVVSLVDLPELDPRAVARILTPPLAPADLRQATYAGRPGHPVLIGAAHLAPLAAGLSGDRGARPYLAAHAATEVDCTDLGGGDDVDSLPDREANGPRRG